MNQGKMAAIIIAVLVVIGMAWTYLHCTPFQSCPWLRSTADKSPKKVTLSFYGARDTEEDWSGVIEKFRIFEQNNRHLNVTVEYKQLDQYNYEDLVYDSLVNKKGPNIFMMFNSWLPKYQARITEMPSGMMTMDEFEKNFVPVAKDDLVKDGKIYSMPLYVDTPALFYNKEMFYNAGITRPPENWDEFADDVEKLTQLDKDGKITRSGAAFGGAKYVNRSQDIAMLMVMQNNMKADDTRGNPVSFGTSEAKQAVKLYTDFTNSSNRFYTWDYNSQIYSIDAFIQGTAAMSMNYSYEIANIDSKTQDGLDYGVALMPQKYENNKANYASYWAPVVAKGAECIKEDGVTMSCEDISWDFINFVATHATQEGNTKKYDIESYLKSANRPAAHVDIIEKQMGEIGSKLAPFAEQTLTAKSWGNANNKKSDEVLLNMLDTIITTDTAKKKTVESAMKLAVDNVKELE